MIKIIDQFLESKQLLKQFVQQKLVSTLNESNALSVLSELISALEKQGETDLYVTCVVMNSGVFILKWDKILRQISAKTCKFQELSEMYPQHAHVIPNFDALLFLFDAERSLYVLREIYKNQTLPNAVSAKLRSFSEGFSQTFTYYDTHLVKLMGNIEDDGAELFENGVELFNIISRADFSIETSEGTIGQPGMVFQSHSSKRMILCERKSVTELKFVKGLRVNEYDRLKNEFEFTLELNERSIHMRNNSLHVLLTFPTRDICNISWNSLMKERIQTCVPVPNLFTRSHLMTDVSFKWD